MNNILEKLKSLDNLISQDLLLVRLKNIIETELFHLSLDFYPHFDLDKFPAYNIPYSKTNRAKAISDALKRVDWFLDITNECLNKKLNYKIDSSETKIECKNNLSEQAIIDDPLTEYKKYHNRLIEFGQEALFPEFENTINAISNAITNRMNVDFPSVKIIGNNLKSEIKTIKLYGLPYKMTWEFIIKAVFYFDSIERSIYQESSNYHTVEQSWLYGKSFFLNYY